MKLPNHQLRTVLSEYLKTNHPLISVVHWEYLKKYASVYLLSFLISHSKAAQEFDRCSLGQKKCRHREKANRRHVWVNIWVFFHLINDICQSQSRLRDDPALVNPRRSAAQHGWRQWELAKQMQLLLQTKSPDNVQSRAQTLPRRVEKAERQLRSDAVCSGWSYSTQWFKIQTWQVDPTEALNQALDKEFKINNPRRENRYRPSRREQMLGSEEYHRLLSMAKQSECERRECEAQHS
jgi:hypothetical protein